MKRSSRIAALFPALAIGLVLSLSVAETADAARRGGFGSRGARTYQMPRSTQTAPRAAQPIDRSMTSREQAAAPTGARPTAATPQAQPRRPGFLGGLGGGLLGGLMLGGLFGMMMGHGFGGGAGLLALLVQVGLIALVLMLAFRFFGRRHGAPAYAGPAPGYQEQPSVREVAREADVRRAAGGASAPGHDQIGIQDADFETFERLLAEIQAAYGREDYATLRDRTTPEVMGFLAEELARNASDGRRNEITDAKLLQGDLSEAWREGDADYATVAMRYQSLDVVRDRASGRVLEGDPERPVEVTEVWTFRRDGGPWGGGWKLSAVQEA